MKGLSYGTQSAAGSLFWQFEGDSVFERVMEMVGSCSSSVRMFRKCTKSLLKLGLTGMIVVLCYASFLQL